MAFTTYKVIINDEKKLLSLDHKHGIDPEDALRLALTRANFNEYYKIEYQTKAIIYTRFPELLRHPANCQIITNVENIKKSHQDSD